MFSTQNYENEENEQKKQDAEPEDEFAGFDVSDYNDIKDESEPAQEMLIPEDPDEVVTEKYHFKPEKTEKIAEITDVVEDEDDVIFDIPVDLIDDGDFSDHVKELVMQDSETVENKDIPEPVEEFTESPEQIVQTDEIIEDDKFAEHIENVIAEEDKKAEEALAKQVQEKITTDEFFNREFLGKKPQNQDESSVGVDTEPVKTTPELSSENDNEFKKTHKFDSENESLWHEALEEHTLPSFEIETVHQFRSFIKVGARVLYENDELDPERPLSEDQKALVADLGQFIHAYGSYARWKEEKDRLIKEHNEAITDLKTLYKKHQDQKKRLELTLRENANLIEKFDDYEESIKTFEDLKSRNDYLESETKKFNALLGFSELDISEEFKKRIADTKTLDISARFLHKAWKKDKLVLSQDKVIISAIIKRLGEILNKPFNAGKLRLQLIEFVKELDRDIAEKKERYLKLDDRSFNNPLNNKELKEYVEISEYFTQLMILLKKLSKIIESSRN